VQQYFVVIASFKDVYQSEEWEVTRKSFDDNIIFFYLKRTATLHKTKSYYMGAAILTVSHD